MHGRRVVVTVAVGDRADTGKSGEENLVGKPFLKNMSRWQTSFGMHAGCSLMTFTKLKPGWPTHESVPYGFKVYAIMQAAAMGYTEIIWADSSVVAFNSLAPLWEKIEKDGYFLLDNEPWNCGQWTSDRVLEFLLVDRELAFTIPQVCMTVFGLNLNNFLASHFLVRYKDMADLGLFQGPWVNDKGEASSDKRVLGHRHDQTVASFIVRELMLQTTPQKEVLAPRSDYPRALMENVR